jgi:hypothetical protein
MKQLIYMKDTEEGNMCFLRVIRLTSCTIINKGCYKNPKILERT